MKSYRDVAKRLADLERRTYLPDVTQLSDAELEALVAEQRRADPVLAAVFDRLSDAELDALCRMSEEDAEVFLRSKINEDLS